MTTAKFTRGRYGEPWYLAENNHVNTAETGTHGWVLMEDVAIERRKRACDCVNALAGCNPAALANLLEAIDTVLLDAHLNGLDVHHKPTDALKIALRDFKAVE